MPSAPDWLWPKPYSVLFDFAATAAGAEWIDDLGWRAKRLLAGAAGQPVVGHNDWSAKHFRFTGSTVHVIRHPLGGTRADGNVPETETSGQQ